jgi:hypothetical protein
MIALLVMPGLVPGIHVLIGFARKAWMAGTSPAMTQMNHCGVMPDAFTTVVNFS